jgi:transposase, IS5 family
VFKHSLFADQECHADAAVDHAAPCSSRECGGCSPFSTKLMVLMLFILKSFNLSDEQMKFQLLDRLSCQRFARLLSSSQIPDRAAIWTFIERLSQAGLTESIVDEVIHYIVGNDCLIACVCLGRDVS